MSENQIKDEETEKSSESTQQIEDLDVTESDEVKGGAGQVTFQIDHPR